MAAATCVASCARRFCSGVEGGWAAWTAPASRPTSVLAPIAVTSPLAATARDQRSGVSHRGAVGHEGRSGAGRRGLVDGCRLPSEQRLARLEAFGRDDPHVGRHEVARLEVDEVAEDQPLGGQQHRVPGPHRACRTCSQVGQSRDRHLGPPLLGDAEGGVENHDDRDDHRVGGVTDSQRQRGRHQQDNDHRLAELVQDEPNEGRRPSGGQRVEALTGGAPVRGEPDDQVAAQLAGDVLRPQRPDGRPRRDGHRTRRDHPHGWEGLARASQRPAVRAGPLVRRAPSSQAVMREVLCTRVCTAGPYSRAAVRQQGLWAPAARPARRARGRNGRGGGALDRVGQPDLRRVVSALSGGGPEHVGGAHGAVQQAVVVEDQDGPVTRSEERPAELPQWCARLDARREAHEVGGVTRPCLRCVEGLRAREVTAVHDAEAVVRVDDDDVSYAPVLHQLLERCFCRRQRDGRDGASSSGRTQRAAFRGRRGALRAWPWAWAGGARQTPASPGQEPDRARSTRRSARRPGD